MSRRKTAILFKSEKEGSVTDPYIEELGRHGVDAVCVPVLGFTFVNVQTLCDVLRSPSDHSGIVLTSPRAVDAIRNVCYTGRVLKDTEWDTSLSPTWSKLPAYVVGQASASAAEKLGFTPVGQDSGNAENLVKTIIEERSADDLPLLFPCGNLRKETVPATLQSKGIPLRCLTVYQTTADPGIQSTLASLPMCTLGRFPDCLVYFSPSGVEFTQPVLSSLKFPLEKIKLIAIGPSTEEALRKKGLTVAGTASKPTPQDVAVVIETIEGH